MCAVTGCASSASDEAIAERDVLRYLVRDMSRDCRGCSLDCYVDSGACRIASRIDEALEGFSEQRDGGGQRISDALSAEELSEHVHIFEMHNENNALMGEYEALKKKADAVSEERDYWRGQAQRVMDAVYLDGGHEDAERKPSSI